MTSGKAKIGSTSIGTSLACSRAAVSAAGIRSYFANHASARARSPVASCSSSSLARRAIAGRHLRVVDAVAAAAACAIAPCSDRIVELHHLGAAVRLAGAEAHRAEDAGDVRRVVLLEPIFRQHALVHQPLQRRTCRRRRPWLLRGRRRVPPMASRMSTCLPSRRANAGPEAVADLVHQHRRQIALGRRRARLRRVHDARGERQDDLVHARVHEVLEEDLLRALLLVDARIVRQVVGDGLIAVAQIARAERRVHHLHRRRVAAHRRTVRRRQAAARPGYRASTADRPRACGSPPRCESGRRRRTTSSRRAGRRGTFRTARR